MPTFENLDKNRKNPKVWFTQASSWKIEFLSSHTTIKKLSQLTIFYKENSRLRQFYKNYTKLSRSNLFQYHINNFRKSKKKKKRTRKKKKSLANILT